MKFTPKEDFKHGPVTFEAGNTYSSEKHGLSTEDVHSFHANGWAEVEGLDPAPPRQVKGVSVEVANTLHQSSTTEI